MRVIACTHTFKSPELNEGSSHAGTAADFQFTPCRPENFVQSAPHRTWMEVWFGLIMAIADCFQEYDCPVTEKGIATYC